VSTPGAWDWAVAAYARPEVEAALMELQDRWGQNVPLLLVGAWAAVSGRPFAAERLEAAVDTARVYEETVVGPLRAIRRTLKGPTPDIDDASRLAIREQIKALELDAERRLIGALEAIATEAPAGKPETISSGLVSVAHLWSRVIPRSELADLAARLST
jgi:uncharacterized protein (TIGR02444 family)